MKKLIIVLASFLVCILSLFALAPQMASAHGGKDHFGPFHTANDPDGGSCSSPWALDTFDRFFTVHKNSNGTFTVQQDYKHGSFVTTGPASPGACETGSKHGTIVNAGVRGTFSGFLKGTVSGGTYNKHGCDANPGTCASTAGFIAAVFPGGTYTCLSGPANACRFAFEYHASRQGLKFHEWEDENNSAGTEIFTGDIANQ